MSSHPFKSPMVLKGEVRWACPAFTNGSSLSPPAVERSNEQARGAEPVREARRASSAPALQVRFSRMVELLAVRRRLVAKSSVKPAGVAKALDEAEDSAPRPGQGRKLPPVETVVLERRKEALAHRVVVRISDRAHRLHDAGLRAPLAEPQRPLLRALVAVMDHRTLRQAAGDRHPQRLADQFGRRAGRHGRADDPRAPRVEHPSEVQPPRPSAHLCDVGHPQLVGVQ